MARNLSPSAVSITAISINGDSVTSQFYKVTQLEFDYNKGVVRILDATGEFFFPYTPVTVVTYTIINGTANVVIL